MINNTQEVDDYHYTDTDAAIDNLTYWLIGVIIMAIGLFWATS